jgi:hypothetical protein
VSGSSGTSGSNGTSGSSGTSGTSGAAGGKGASGTSGSNGATGGTGSAGTSGSSGAAASASPYVPIADANVCTCDGTATLTNVRFSAIFGGITNKLCGWDSFTKNDYQTIAGGEANEIKSLAATSQMCHNFIGGGASNFTVSSCAKTLCLTSIIGGKENRIQSYTFGGKSSNTCLAFVGGGYINAIERTPSHTAIFGGYRNCMTSSVSYAAIIGANQLNATASNYTCANYLVKTSGKFSIRHPDPAKKHTHNLVHSFVEAPTAGDNLYRYEVTTLNCEASVSLPDYYKFLNCNDQVWITPKNHLGVAYGDVNATQTEINIKSNCDGSYYVLLMGTRKDDAAQKFRGVEQERIICRSKC